MTRFSNTGKSLNFAAMRHMVKLRPMTLRSRKRDATERSVITARNSFEDERDCMKFAEFVRASDRDKAEGWDLSKISWVTEESRMWDRCTWVQ